MNITNISDLANYLGVSKSTVSRALQDSYEISKETKEKVLKAAKALNYQPNPYASSLKKHKSKTIAVVVPQFNNNYFVEVIKGIQSVAYPNDYHVLLYFTYENHDVEEAIFNHLVTGRVDGVIISPVKELGKNKHIIDFVEHGVPVLFFDRTVQNIFGTKIITNNEEITYQATKILIDKGCKKLCYINAYKDITVVKKRFVGFNKAAEENNLKATIIDYEKTEEADKQICKLLKSNQCPDGIISPDENAVITIYRVCKKMNINIPKDIKIISFSNLAFPDLLSPSLSTIDPPAYNMGESAAELLINSLNKKSVKLENEEIILPSKITERESSGV